MSVDLIMPKVDMVMETGTFVEWLKNEGEAVEKGEALFVILTDKATIECEAPASGVLAGVTARPGQVIPVTQTIGYLLGPGEPLPASAVPEPGVPEKDRPAGPERGAMAGASAPPAAGAPGEALEPASEVVGSLVRATPLARSLARLQGIDLAQIHGRGPQGRIYKADVLEASRRAESQPVAAEPAAPSTPKSAPIMEFPLPAASVRERIPLGGPRAIIARRMAYSASVIPHIYESVTVDGAELVRLRQKRSAAVLEQTGHKLTYTAILAYLVSRVLPRHPYLNSSLVGEEIMLWEDVNLGLAADLGEDLVVPVVRQAQRKDLGPIAAEIGQMLESARTRKLGPEAMRDGTFTISNLGMYGIESFTALINPPEAAILSVGRLVEAEGGRTAMTLVLGVDHRIVDGARAARFLVALKEAIEYPYFLG